MLLFALLLVFRSLLLLFFDDFLKHKNKAVSEVRRLFTHMQFQLLLQYRFPKLSNGIFVGRIFEVEGLEDLVAEQQP